MEQRAVRGVSLLVGRTLAVQVLTVGGTIVLARLVAPAEYGLFAIALAVQQLGRSLAELGLAAALLAREQPPSRRELQCVGGVVAVSAATLASGVALLVLLAAAVGLPVRAGAVVAVAVAALPIYALRLIPIVRLERALRFREIVAMELVETLGFYAVAVPAASAGLDAFALSAAVPISAVLGTAVVWALAPGPLPTGLQLAVVRPLLAFGARVSILTPLQLGREVATTVALAAVGGQALAGFYSLSVRLLSLLTALSYAVQRVALPALARVPPGSLRRERATTAATLSLVAASLPISLVVGAAAPLVATLFGARWLPAVDIVSASALGILVFASVGAVELSLALADGDARRPVRAFVTYATLQLAVALALPPWLGATAAGLAVTTGSVAFAAMLLWPLRGPERQIAVGAARTAAVALLAVLAGRAAAGGGTDVGALVGAAAASGAAWVAASFALNAQDARRLVAVLRRHIRRKTSV